MIHGDLAKALHRRCRREDWGYLAHPAEIERSGIERFDHKMTRLKFRIRDRKVRPQVGVSKQQARISLTFSSYRYPQSAGIPYAARASRQTSGESARASQSTARRSSLKSFVSIAGKDVLATWL
ncbi:hypothetical protein ACFSLT_20140 [Novosphingobium resinovorum]